MKAFRHIFAALVFVAAAGCKKIDGTIKVELDREEETPILAYPFTTATIGFDVECLLPVEIQLSGLGMSWRREYDDESKMRGRIILTFDDSVGEDSFFTFRATNGNTKYDVVKEFTFEREVMQKEGQNSFSMPYKGGTVDLGFKSNSEFEVIVPEDASSWIRVVATKAVQSHTVTLYVAANNGLERTATIKVRSTTSSLTQEYVINQSADLKTFSFTSSSKTVSLPQFAGTDIAGYVFWTPAATPQRYAAGMSHTFTTTPNTVSVDLVNATSASFSTLTGLTEIDLTKF